MHNFGKVSLALAVFGGLTLAAGHPAHAQNLVKDGGFESADAGAPDDSEDAFTPGSPFDTSWTVDQGTAAIDTNNLFVFDGSKSLFLDSDVSTTTTVSQSLATTPGANYILSFYADDAGSNPLTVNFGGTAIGPINIPQNGYPNSDPDSNAAQFTLFSYSVTASTPLTKLSFSAANSSNGEAIELDDISVQAVPEASTLVSMGLMLGLGGLAVAVRKKRTASA